MIRSMTSKFTLTALALCLVLAAPALQARDLSGRIYLGDRTQLHLQEDESVVTNILRKVKLVTREVPVMNLNSIAIQNDYLFIGEDHELYYMDKMKRDHIYHVGSAQDLSNIKLADGVVLKAVENVSANFESGQREVTLKVVMNKEMEPAEAGTKRGQFKHWLAELDSIYDESMMSEFTKRNYMILMNAITTAIPDGDNEDPRAFEHLKILKKYIEAGTYPSAVPLQQIVDTMLKKVKANMDIEDNAQAAKDVLPAYQKLSELLSKAAN